MSEIIVSDVTRSQIVIGDRNVALQVLLDGGSGYSDRAASEPLRPRPLAVLNPRRTAEPVGRDELVEQAAAALLAGQSVQLCGVLGVGKTAVAEAVARRLAAERRQGVVLAAGTVRDDLPALYTDLAKLFFSVSWYTPDEAVLRAETARHRPSGVIVVPDCALSAQDADRLLGTFPDCAFLLCSQQQSLYSGQPVLDIEPLSLDEARQLVERELGRPLEGLEHVQVARIHELGEGRTARLLVCAAFLRRAAADARQHTTVPLTPGEQTSVLVEGISEQARRVLVALCGFGPAAPEAFDALTGLEGTEAAGEELEHAGLATRSGTVLTATEDARAAVSGHGWTPDPRAAAEGLLRAGRPEPRLSVAVARALLEAGAPERVSAFARAAAPIALADGDVDAWRALVTLGLRTAREGRRSADLAYFLGEDHTAALLRGDRVAAALALTALGAELAHLQAHAVPAVTHTPQAPSRPSGVRSLRHGLKARYGGLAAGALIAAVGIGAVGAVAGAAYGSAVLTAHHHGSGGSAAGAAKAASTSAPVEQFPYTVTDQPYYKAAGGTTPYFVSAQFPVISDLPDKAVEQKINAELRAPLEQVLQVKPQYGTVPGSSRPDATTSQTSVLVYQVGSLISVEYDSTGHFAGGADTFYSLQTVTVRTDTGAVIPSTGILSAGATKSAEFADELQAQPDISSCDESQGWSGAASLAAGLQQSNFVVNVSSGGLLIAFQDDAISGTLCRPVAFLSWGQLSGLVNPEIEQLANQAVGRQGTAAPSASASATVAASAPATTASAAAGASPSIAPTSPAAVIQAYYAAINTKNYEQAWKLGGDTLGESYSKFATGFTSTKSDTIVVNSVSGDTVHVTLTATQDDGSVSRFTGTYTVSGSAFTSAHLVPSG